MNKRNFRIERSWATEPLFYEAPVPPTISARRYQQAAVEFCLARDHALIGDAPGLGKTCEGVLISNAIEARRTLVVCPASLRLNWEREVWKWSTITNVKTYPILTAKDGVSPVSNYTIISYDMLRNAHILDAILALRWDHMILDEGHYLKDPNGNKRTHAICAPDGLPSVVGRITMLSGTILPNQPIEIYNAAKLLDWDCIDRMSVDGFRSYYYEYGEGYVTGKYLTKDKKGNPVWKYGPHWSTEVRNVPRRLDELRDRLRGSIMIRRLKEHVLTELPSRQWHLVPLANDKGIKKALVHPGWVKAEKLYEINPGAFNSSAPIDGAFGTAWRMLGEAKAPQVAAYAEELLQEGVQKLVIGAWHLSVLSILREKLDKYGVAYMDGSVGQAKRQKEVDRFQEDDDTRIILGQMQPLGEGWTLTRAQDIILAEPHPVPGRNDQLFDRIHRIGQEGEHVICHVPIVPNTLDERMMARAVEKDINIQEALDGPRGLKRERKSI